MQQKQITQKQITQKNITQHQFTRHHNSHQHQMTLSDPQRDMRQFNIPSGTIVEEAPRKIRFAYLRSWIMSLLALIALPLGAILILTGTSIAEDLPRDWETATAEVTSFNDSGTNYAWTVNGETFNGEVSRDWKTHISTKTPGGLVGQVSLCDVASLVLVQREIGNEFTVWYNPQAPTNHQCVPITKDAGTSFMIAGWVLVVLSLWIFLRVFHRAGIQLAQANAKT